MYRGMRVTGWFTCARARVCVCVCVCVRARVCACVMGGGGGRQQVLSVWAKKASALGGFSVPVLPSFKALGW